MNKKEWKKRKSDWREPYRGSRAVDSTCRSHGSCPYCASGRKHKHDRHKPLSDA